MIMMLLLVLMHSRRYQPQTLSLCSTRYVQQSIEVLRSLLLFNMRTMNFKIILELPGHPLYSVCELLNMK